MNFDNKFPNPINIVGDMGKINFSLDDFKDIREGNFLYIDKTKMIEDLLTYDERKVILFTRPRRFGKSLNLSMLRYFFDKGEDSRNLFQGLYIENSKVFEASSNQFPVLWLNFKDANIDSRKNVSETIVDIMKSEIRRLYEKYQFKELLEISLQTDEGDVRVNKIKEITEILYKKTNRRTVVLIDEYDALLNQTYGSPYWEEIAGLIKKIFGALLKSNEYLEMGVLTGVNRLGKELGFSDLNNLAVYGLTNPFYYEYYGFTQKEATELLKRYKVALNEDFIRMYNGYHMEESPHVFNTSSILKFVDNYTKSEKINLLPYWINSGANSILKDNIRKMDMGFRNKLLNLLDGGTVIEGIFENVEYDSLDKPAHMFSLLIDTGYLCPIRSMGGDLFEIKIPNEEVLYGYKAMIDSIVGTGGEVLENLCNFLLADNMESFESKLNDVLLQVSSFNDFSEKENSYHCLLEGALLYVLGKFKVRSNREAGMGRFDISLIPADNFKKIYHPIIIEFKAAIEKPSKKEYSEDELLLLAKKALEQIEAKKYYEEYRDEYEKSQFTLIGIGAQGKRCKVMKAFLN